MEFGAFKEAFFAGDLIWLKNVVTEDEVGIRRVLERLRVRSSCVEIIGLEDVLNGKTREWVGSEIEVRVIRLDRRLSEARRAEFVSALRWVLENQKKMGFRILLISERRTDLDWHEDLCELKPVVLEFTSGNNEGFMNDAVHDLLDMASGHAQVKVARLSERAAYFLEEIAKSKVDGELVALVVLGLKRSDGKVLRFRDLLPNFHRHFEGGDQGETV